MESSMFSQNSSQFASASSKKETAPAKVNSDVFSAVATEGSNTRASVSVSLSPKKVNLLPNKPVSIDISENDVMAHSAPAVSAIKDNITTSTPSHEKTANKIASPAVRTPSCSIYALVKKASSAKPSAQPIASPVPTSSANGTPVRKRSNDTFSDSGDSDCEDDTKRSNDGHAGTDSATTPTAQFDRDMDALEAEACDDESHADSNCDRFVCN